MEVLSEQFTGVWHTRQSPKVTRSHTSWINGSVRNSPYFSPFFIHKIHEESLQAALTSLDAEKKLLIESVGNF